MENIEQKMDEAQLRGMGTTELVRHALEEMRLLVKAEVLHAKHEVRDEIVGAKVAGILFGVAAGLGLCGIAVLFVALAMAIPLSEGWAALIIGVGLLVIAAVCVGIGVRRVPTKPLPKTQQRLRQDYNLAREQLS